MNQKYIVILTQVEREYLENLVSSGVAPARMIRRARILLKSDSESNWTYARISEALDISQVTIYHVRKSYIEGGLEAALMRKQPDREYKRSFDKEAEAYLIALLNSKPPKGKKRWTLRSLQEKIIEVGIVESVSYETIRTVLKNSELSLSPNGKNR